MIYRTFALLAVILFALVFIHLISGYTEQSALRPLAEHYVTRGPVELGAPNIVTGILITYRGFDTLGEVAVLFMVAASVGLLLNKNEGDLPETGEDQRRPVSEIVATGSQVLLPVIFTFGAYVIVNGHLSAGGGFQGGAIVASGVMLMLLARPGSKLNAAALSVIESLAGVFYVSVGILGLILAGGFLDPRFLPLGESGAFISAGAIPLISALLGIKVGAELSVIIDRFRI
jgi:multicomponent Na+:H+ antiporter subunit B